MNIQWTLLASTLTGHIQGNTASRNELEALLQSDEFWEVFYSNVNQDATFFHKDESRTRLCLLLFSRRLRDTQCNDNTVCNFLLEQLSPLAGEESIGPLLATVLADVVVQTYCNDEDKIVRYVMSLEHSTPLFRLSFLSEIAISVGRTEISTENREDDVDQNGKLESIISLQSDVLTYCYEIISNVHDLDVPTSTSCVSCITSWLTVNLLSPPVLEHTQVSISLEIAENVIFDGSLNRMTILEAVIVYSLNHSRLANGHSDNNVVEPLLDAICDLLEVLFARCWENRCSPNSKPGSLDPTMRLSDGNICQLIFTVSIGMMPHVQSFLRSLVVAPACVFGGSFLPDTLLSTITTIAEDISGSYTVTNTPTTLFRVMTRLVAVCVKMLTASPVSPTHFSRRVDDNETIFVYDLLTCLATASGIRCHSIAAIAFEACIYAHHRILERGPFRVFYKILMQTALRHSCKVYCLAGDEAVDVTWTEWLLIRDEFIGDIVRIVHEQLQGEYFEYLMGILQEYIPHRHTTEAISVVTGTLFSVQMCSPTLTRNSLRLVFSSNTQEFTSIDTVSNSIESTEFLVNFIQTILKVMVDTVPNDSLASQSSPIKSETLIPSCEIEIALNQLIERLAFWLSKAKSCSDLKHFTSSFSSYSTALQETCVLASSIFQLLGAGCLQHVINGFTSLSTMPSAARALEEFCNHNKDNLVLNNTHKDSVEISSRTQCVNALVTNCWIPALSITLNSDNTPRTGISRHEVLTNLLTGVLNDTACPYALIGADVLTGSNVRFDIQRRTLNAISHIVVTIPHDVEECIELNEETLLYPLQSVLTAVLATITDSSSSSNSYSNVASEGAADEVVGALRLMSAMICNGLAISPIINMMLGCERTELSCLLEYFSSCSLETNKRISAALMSLCIALIRMVDAPATRRCNLAIELFSKYVCHSCDSELYVIHLLDVLGARESHLQRLKQRIGSTYGEFSEEVDIEAIENALCFIVIETCSRFHGLLTEITTATINTPRYSSSTLCGDGSTNSETDPLIILGKHLNSLEACESQLNARSKNPYPSALFKLLQMFQQVLSATPSLIHYFPKWITQGCVQVSILCIDYSKSEPALAQQAVSVISQVINLKKKIVSASQSTPMAVWEIGLEKALVQALNSETVLVGVLIQLFGKENESKSNNSRFPSLSKCFVTLLYEVLEDCHHTSSTEFGKFVPRILRVMHQRKLLSPFSDCDMNNILGVFVTLFHTRRSAPPKLLQLESTSNSLSFSNFGLLVAEISWNHECITTLSKYDRFITV